MRFDILTIFPEIFDSYFQESILKRAIESQKIAIFVHDIRTFSKDKHQKVDASPYGGGPGMVMMPQPLYDAILHVKNLNSGPVFYMSPRGKILTQTKVVKLAKQLIKGSKNYKQNRKILAAKVGLQGGNSFLTAAYKEIREDQKGISNAVRQSLQPKSGLILVCGRYEGIDQRIIDLLVDEELSIGKYVLTGGELAAMVIIDAVSRYLPGVLGDEQSHEEESFSKALKGKKEYPHYTRPEVFQGLKVPEILLSGHHAKIKKWREENLG